ncbi:MAG: aminoacyl-tRNA hydrolase [Candidatus Marinimicrobia bacterium]|nr:aminoacyl-tRNA hydrolase [Candidatus Neomarinimicrobiota bacterium]
MIKINKTISIPDDELKFNYTRSSGPGGQNVNKVSSAVYLRFDVRNTSSLTEKIKIRLIELAGKRVSKKGVLIIKAQRYRTQAQNRREAIERLVGLIQSAALKPVYRKKTRPPQAVKERRLIEKHKHSLLKQARKPVDIAE